MDLTIEHLDGWWYVYDSCGNIVDGFDCEDDAIQYAIHLSRKECEHWIL